MSATTGPRNDKITPSVDSCDDPELCHSKHKSSINAATRHSVEPRTDAGSRPTTYQRRAPADVVSENNRRGGKARWNGSTPEDRRGFSLAGVATKAINRIKRACVTSVSSASPENETLVPSVVTSVSSASPENVRTEHHANDRDATHGATNDASQPGIVSASCSVVLIKDYSTENARAGADEDGAERTPQEVAVAEFEALPLVEKLDRLERVGKNLPKECGRYIAAALSQTETRTDKYKHWSYVDLERFVETVDEHIRICALRTGENRPRNLVGLACSIFKEAKIPGYTEARDGFRSTIDADVKRRVKEIIETRQIASYEAREAMEQTVDVRPILKAMSEAKGSLSRYALAAFNAVEHRHETAAQT